MREEPPDPALDDLAAGLMTRLTKLHRLLTRVAVTSSLVLALLFAWWAIADSDVARGGFLHAHEVGVTGGITFCAAFATSIFLSLVASRFWIRRTAEAWRRALVERHGLRGDAMLWVVAMFSPKGKTMGFDELDEISRRGS